MPVLLFLGSVCLFASTAATKSVDTDARAAAIGAWRIASTGKPWLDGVDPAKLTGYSAYKSRPDQWLSPAPNGHVVAQRMAGPIVAGVPFYAALDRDARPEAFSLVPAALAASILCALSVVAMYEAARARVSVPYAAAGALLFGFATPTWTVSANGLWTHTVTQFGIACAAAAMSRDRWWLTGAFLGVAIMGRPHIALIAAVVGLGVSWSRRRAGIAVRVAIPAISALVGLLLWNRSVFGAWSLGGAYAENGSQAAVALSGQSDQWANYAGFLISANRGLLVWSLAFVVLVPAVIRSWRSLPDWTRWLPLGGVLYSIAQLRLDTFTGGQGFYGYRLGLELMTCLMPALILSMPRMRSTARWVFPPLVALQIAALSVGAVYEAFFIPESQAWTHNAYLFAFGVQPVLVAAWSGLFVLAGLGISLMLTKRAVSTSPQSA